MYIEHITYIYIYAYIHVYTYIYYITIYLYTELHIMDTYLDECIYIHILHGAVRLIVRIGAKVPRPFWLHCIFGHGSISHKAAA